LNGIAFKRVGGAEAWTPVIPKGISQPAIFLHVNGEKELI
jgi:hypothetical protein